MDKERFYNRIEEYLSGQMSGTERDQFEAEIEQNDELKKEVELHKDLSESLGGEKFHEFRRMVSETDKQWNDRSSESGGRIVQFSTGIRAIAAVVIVMLGVSLWFWFGSSADNAELYAQHFAPYEMVLTQRSIQQGGDLYKEAIGYYNSKDFVKAHAAFRQLTQHYTDQPIFKLYECLSMMAGGLDGDMEECLTPVLENQRLAQQARWYLGLSYLRNDETEKAREMFSAIRSHEYKYAEAQEILGSLGE